MTLNCPKCGAKLEAEIKFCKQCGAPISTADLAAQQDRILTCPYCEALNLKTATRCRICGSPLEPLTGQVAGRPTQTLTQTADANQQPTEIIQVSAQEQQTSILKSGRVTGPLETPPAQQQEESSTILISPASPTEQNLATETQVMAAPPPPTTQTMALQSADIEFVTAEEVAPGPGIEANLAQTATEEITAGQTQQVQVAKTGPTAETGEVRLVETKPVTLEQLKPPAQLERTIVMPRPAPQPAKPKKKAALITAFAIMLIALAAYLVWRFYPRGAQPAQSVKVQAPAQPESVPTQPAAPRPPEGMVLVEAGTYIIGRDDGDPYSRPQYTVQLPAFFIDRTEVTNAEYKRFVEATNHKPPDNWKDGTYPPGEDLFPVTGVSWQDAADYAKWAGKRLPTEVEWEAAARGRDGRIYPWGNDWIPDAANIGTNGIVEVGRFLKGASPAGTLDMIGNVWEWTADEFKLYPGSSARMPELEPGVTYRVIRGGAYDGSRMHDATYRGFIDSSKGYPKVGFRCVKDIR
jgi:formylglycine-generating enzyme required for sulfatase activity/ribosomal protein L40E